jgi:hypothetical protein
LSAVSTAFLKNSHLSGREKGTQGSEIGKLTFLIRKTFPRHYDESLWIFCRMRRKWDSFSLNTSSIHGCTYIDGVGVFNGIFPESPQVIHVKYFAAVTKCCNKYLCPGICRDMCEWAYLVGESSSVSFE